MRSAFSTDGIILASALASDTTINYKALYNEASKKYQSQLEKLHNYDNYQECVAAINTQDPYERVLNMRALLMHASRQGSGGVMNLFGYTAQDLEWIVGPLMPMVKEVMPGGNSKAASVLWILYFDRFGKSKRRAIPRLVCQDV